MAFQSTQPQENMETFGYKLHSILLLFFSVLISSHANYDQQAQTLQSYIVHVEPSPDSDPYSILTSDEQREGWYKSFLPSDSRLIYSYHEAASGFAARLTGEELAEIERKPGFLHAYPDRIVPLQTTHTPRFLGLDRLGPGPWKRSNFGRGVIVGVLDTGVEPDHPSFRDNGLVPPPSNKWRGGCDFNKSVCNNKLIGARNFVRGMHAMTHASLSLLQEPPVDTEGHGTHTASTAAGMFVDGANVEGEADGTAAGMAPYAHLAIYKVCSERGCANSDILAAMDMAISDGVDVMSLSLGGASEAYYNDATAIGALAAVQRGIFVSCAGGNSGPSAATLSNEAPWILTVGASSVDRTITAAVSLGNGKQIDGQSIHQPKGYPSPPLPLVDARSACASLDGIDVKGKIVVCDAGHINGLEKGKVVKAAGGAGMIIANIKSQGYTNAFMDAHVLPASAVSYADGVKIKSYINSSTSATASFAFEGTATGKSVVAPAVAYFSSRGPSQVDGNVLKPDIVGPGVSVLAAWPFKVGDPGTRYNMISGTSMATPHLSGIAAVLKSAHPEWSPAAIKSAIMTTAYTNANNGKPIPDQDMKPAGLFAVGAGHVDPVAACDPGLVYDTDPNDYIAYLCGYPYTDSQVSAVARTKVNCSDYAAITGSQLNYPSIVVVVNAGGTATVTRTVTNVGDAGSAYTVEVAAPAGAAVTVEPREITFERVNERRRFSVTFAGKASGGGGIEYSEGQLTWVSEKHRVRSPVVVQLMPSPGSRQSM